MRMAKTQKATLDPSKISGYCGRLKCCLRYEDKTYTELKRRLPRRNTIVRTPNGKGRVIDTHILSQLAVVVYENSDTEAVAIEEIEILEQPRKGGKKKENRPSSKGKQPGKDSDKSEGTQQKQNDSEDKNGS